MEEACHRCAADGDVLGLLHLIGLGIDLNCEGEGGRTPLHEAAKGGHLACVELLLQNGAAVDVVDVEDLSALDYAIAQGESQGVVEKLVSW